MRLIGLWFGLAGLMLRGALRVDFLVSPANKQLKESGALLAGTIETMLPLQNGQLGVGAAALETSPRAAVLDRTHATGWARPQLRLYRAIEKADPQVVTCLFCLLIIAVLEFAHPHYFFGDDNMQATFVQMTETARNLVHGQSIFIHHHIFGGDFDVRDDPIFLYCYHPLVLICSLLTLTPWKFWTLDLLISIYIIAAGWAMARLLAQLRNSKYLQLSNTLVVFLSASYACSGYALVVGASWGHFVGNIATLPMFLLGMFHPRVTRGVAWVCFATLLATLAGSVDPYCHSLVFVSLFGAFLAFKQKSTKPVAILAIGTLLAFLVASPLLWRAWCGFQTCSRAGGLTIPASNGSIPFGPVLAGYFLGWFAHFFAWPTRLTLFVHPWASFIFSFNFSSALVLVAFRRWRKRGLLCHVPLLLALFAVLLVVHPAFLSRLIAQVPVFRSFSHPLRQLMFFHFFMVLWLAFNIGRVSLRDSAKLFSVGIFIFVYSLARLGHTALSDFGDRDFILSGRAERYWEQIRRDIPSDAVLVTVGDCSSWFFRYPLSLAGGNNFPVLYGVTMAAGYTPTKPLISERTRIPFANFLSFYNYDALPRLLKVYKKLYVIEVAPHSVMRMGVVDATGKFVNPPKTVDCDAAISTGVDATAFEVLHPAPPDLPGFANSPLGNGRQDATLGQ